METINDKLTTAKLTAFLVGKPIVFAISLAVAWGQIQASTEENETEIDRIKAEHQLVEMEVRSLDRKILIMGGDVDRNKAAVEKMDRQMDRANILLDRIATKLEGIEIPEQVD